MSLPQTVLAIDPGSLKLGWAVLRGDGIRPVRLASGTLKMPPTAPLPERLGRLLGELTALLDLWQPAALAIESAFVHTNPHTALVLGQARGLPIALAAARGIAVSEYPPALVKRTIVGSGRAAKGQVQQLVALLLQLPDLPQEDEADALAVGLTHLRRSVSLHAAAGRSAVPAVALAPAPVPMTAARALYAEAVAAAKRQAAAGGRRSR